MRDLVQVFLFVSLFTDVPHSATEQSLFSHCTTHASTPVTSQSDAACQTPTSLYPPLDENCAQALTFGADTFAMIKGDLTQPATVNRNELENMENETKRTDDHQNTRDWWIP